MKKCTNCGGPLDDNGKCKICGVANFRVDLSEDGCQVLTKVPDEVAFMQTKGLAYMQVKGLNDYYLRKAEILHALNNDIDEHCTDCKEYDQENHRCPRWNRVIRTTMNDEINAELDAIIDELNHNPSFTINDIIKMVYEHKRGEW